LSELAPAYRPRRPTETVLYAVVRDWLETFLAHARDSYEAPLPRYVEDELRGYLKCGVFAHGFVRAHCDSCGHDLLVAFSCKARSVCPSCAGRRMANTAAHLVDRVLPAVPVRQWVLSLPWELRALAAFKADVLSALARIFVGAIFARHQAWAKGQGLGESPTGAVTHVQRFGSSINLNVHFHVMVLDGVFSRDELGRPVFHRAPPPTRAELDEVVRRVHRQATTWLARKGHLRASADAPSQETPAPTSLDACAAIAMGRGMVRALRDDHDAELDGAPDVQPPPAADGAVEHDGFNLHASVVVAGDDDLGRERLMRYGTRPQLALDRLRRLPGGRLAYRIKKLRGGRAKHRVMTPLEFLARLAVIVPPPRYPLLRYHGVLGPRSSWRRDVVPQPREPRPCAPRHAPAGKKRARQGGRPRLPGGSCRAVNGVCYVETTPRLQIIQALLGPSRSTLPSNGPASPQGTSTTSAPASPTSASRPPSEDVVMGLFTDTWTFAE
jgi:putative transposase/transposase-like zinc-binding protein